MIIECPQCQAKYQYGEDRFDGKPSKKIRCAKCQTIFEVKNPAAAGDKAQPKAAAKPAPAARPAPAPPPEPFDSTVARRPRGPGSTEPETTQAGGPLPSGGAPDAKKLTGDRRYSLAILDGPDAGKVFRIEQSKVVIGRSSSDLTLDDIEASRNHAAVEIRDPVVLLYDLESTNGTLVGGEKITGPVELYNHSEFTVGTTTLMLIVTDQE